MKKTVLLISFVIVGVATFGQSEGLKSLNRKCKMVKVYLEEKYGKTIISHDCDVSVKYGNSLESIMSFEDSPECKSKVITNFNNKKYKEIVQVTEQLEYDQGVHIKTKRIKEIASKELSGFSDIQIKYTRFELSIIMNGSVDKTNKESLEKFLAYFNKEENKELLQEQMSSTDEPIRIPQFYLHISSNELDTTAFPLDEFESNTYPQSVVQLEKKYSGDSKLLIEYNIAVDSRHVVEENGIKYIQRRISAINPEDGYSISVGGYNYVNNL